MSPKTAWIFVEHKITSISIKMFVVFVLLFATNFLVAQNFVIPNIAEDSISIQTSTTENIVENALGSTMSMGSSMQSAVENVEMDITDSPLENLVEEIAEETELDIVEDITGMGSGIETISENVEVLSENIEEIVSSPMQSLESSSITENIISEMESSSISPMGSEIIEETMSGNIRELGSTIPTMPYSMNSAYPQQNLPSTNTLSAMEELEMMSDIEGMMPYPPNMGPLSSITSQSSGNYSPPLMESIPGMKNLSPNMPYPNMGPLSSITSQSSGNYSPSLMESIPGMETLSPNMPYLSNMGPLSSMTSQTSGNYSPSLMESIPGMETLSPNMQYLSNMGPLSSITSQNSGHYNSPSTKIPGMGNMSPNMPSGLSSPLSMLESELGQPSPNMPYLGNMSPLMPRPSNMPSTPMEELEYEMEEYPTGLSSMTSYPPNMGLLSPITSTIKEVEAEIEETSIPLMNMINQSPLMPEFDAPVISLPSLGGTLEELEDVTTSNIPLLGALTGTRPSPMRPSSPKMPPGMGSFIEVPSIGSAMGQLEQGINSAARPLMETMPIIGNSLPLLQKPSMGGYPSLPNKENQPLGPGSTMGYGSGSRIPLMNSMLSPFQNLPLMNRFVSPLMNNLSNIPMMPGGQQSMMPGGQQSMMPGGQQSLPGGSLLNPLRQAMSNLKMAQQNMLGSNSMLSSSGLSDLTSLIDQDSLLPSSEKSQFLSQMSNMGPSTLAMMQNMYRMMGNDWQSRLRRKMEKVRQAREELWDAMEALMSGHPEEIPRHIMAAIAALGNSPITTALQYAMNQDRDSLPLIANMSRLILDRVQ